MLRVLLFSFFFISQSVLADVLVLFPPVQKNTLSLSVPKASFNCGLDMDEDQMMVLWKSYLIGSAHDLGYTLAAIAWQESQAGKWLVNVNDGKWGSYGPYHILLSTALKRSGTDNTPFGRNVLAQHLLSLQFSAKYAIMELEYWKHKRKTWREVVQSYNGGWNMNSIKATKYADKIAKKVVLLKQCFGATYVQE